MLVQVIVVVFALSVSLVHTRNVVDTSADRHAGFTEMEHVDNDPKTFKQSNTQSVMLKVNNQQKPVNSENIYQLRTNQNSGTLNTVHESTQTQANRFTVKPIKPRRVDNRAINNNYKLTDSGNYKIRNLDGDNKIYKNDNEFKATSETIRYQNKSLYQQKVNEIVTTGYKFQNTNDDLDPDRIVFLPDMNDKADFERENSISSGVVTPPTKLFTNKPSEIPNSSNTTDGIDLEDRIALNGEKCPTGQTRIRNSDRCVKLDT